MAKSCDNENKAMADSTHTDTGLHTAGEQNIHNRTSTMINDSAE